MAEPPSFPARLTCPPAGVEESCTEPAIIVCSTSEEPDLPQPSEERSIGARRVVLTDEVALKAATAKSAGIPPPPAASAAPSPVLAAARSPTEPDWGGAEVGSASPASPCRYTCEPVQSPSPARRRSRSRERRAASRRSRDRRRRARKEAESPRAGSWDIRGTTPERCLQSSPQRKRKGGGTKRATMARAARTAEDLRQPVTPPRKRRRPLLPAGRAPSPFEGSDQDWGQWGPPARSSAPASGSRQPAEGGSRLLSLRSARVARRSGPPAPVPMKGSVTRSSRHLPTPVPAGHRLRRLQPWVKSQP